MNFLAHLFLSGDNEKILVGNFIGDAVKGRQVDSFPAEIQVGIRLHRAIDSFTDTHPQVAKSKELFRRIYGKHAGIVVDIVYDYLLIRNGKTFSLNQLNTQIQHYYRVLNNHWSVLPSNIKRFLPIMVSNNWLKKYESIKGIEAVLNGMAHHRNIPHQASEAVHIIKNKQEELDRHFLIFFPELQQHVKDFLLNQNNKTLRIN